MKAKYKQRQDGEGFQVPNGELYRLACCDCGLVHDVVFVAEDGEIGMAVKRNARATAQRRRHIKPHEGVELDWYTKGWNDGEKEALKAWQGCRQEFTELRNAMIPAMRLLNEYIESVGGCDHGVGICLCGEWAVYDEAMNALGTLQPNDQGKGQTPQAAVPLDPPVGRDWGNE